MNPVSTFLPDDHPRRPSAIWQGGNTAVAAMTADVTTGYVRADVAYARSFLVQKHLKGTMGEFFAEHFFLKDQLEQNIRGNWTPLKPRTGPQGLDHLFMKTGKNGRLYWMVGESKYGTSQLGTTVNGTRQLSTQWTTERIQRLGRQYSQIAENQNVSCKHMPSVPPKAQLDVPIKGKVVSFWKDANNNWYFSGSPEELRQAQQMAQKMGNSLCSPNCNFRVRLFHVEAVGNDLKITLYEVNPDKVTTIGNMKPSSEFCVKDILGNHISAKEFKKAVAAALRKQFPNLSDEELRGMANDVTKKYKAGEFLKTPRPVWQTITLQALCAAGISAAMDVLGQVVFTRRVQIGRTLITAGGTGVGTASGQIISIVLLKTQIGSQMVRSISSFLNLTRGMTSVALSGLGGGVITSLLLSYGMYWFGYSDLTQAHRGAIAGVSGTLASTCVAVGVPALVAQFGTAGTGTAIAVLHGAAAYNATFACIGGLVGGGVAAGVAITTGGALVALIGVAYLVSIGFAFKDKADHLKYLLLLSEKYVENIWDIVAKNSRIPKQHLAFTC